ncbi:cellulase family glycosylhydrolase [Candidatus Daviesbacteria bacterium]|nr:cellulase family glycosylhydrolase [Candidatus Daviesbacteria bacterium]
MRQKGFLNTPILVILGVLIITAILGVGLYFRFFKHRTPPTKIFPVPPTQTESASPQNSNPPANFAAPAVDNSHFAIHSFIFSNFSTPTKTYLFDAAKRTGKSFIRFDFALTSVEPNQGKFVFGGLDENVKMASDRGLTVVGTLGYSANWIAAAGAFKPTHGPIDPNKYDAYTDYVKQTVAHFPQVSYWEVWNEPDAKALYYDDPASFAKILKLTHDAIKATNPNAKILFPGVVFGNEGWVRSVLNDPANPGKGNFDIGNVHIRGTLSSVEGKTSDVVSIFRSAGSTPIWITEFGYPSDSAFQQDSSYKSGLQSQADYYKVALPKLVSLGADKIFVTLRDMGADESGCGRTGGQNGFCSEGLVTFPSRSATSGTDKPSMAVFQSL